MIQVIFDKPNSRTDIYPNIVQNNLTSSNCISLTAGNYIWNRWYNDKPHFVRPYDMLNYRNHVTDRQAQFIVLARTRSDVIETVKFAAHHNLGISIFSTGHEFNDRNSGPADKTLLIRTTCLRSVDFDLDENNRFNHSDGVVRLGTGLTWGTSIFNYMGNCITCQYLELIVKFKRVLRKKTRRVY